MAENIPSDCKPKMRCLAIAGGFTAGHVITGLALARQYQESFENTSILFIGTPNGFETRLVPQSGHKLEMISCTPIMNQGYLGKIRGVWRGFIGMVQARRILKAEGARLVVGFGSYASAVAILAARQLGLRTVIHEANNNPGIANRFTARFVDKICLGSQSACTNFGVSSTSNAGDYFTTGIEAGLRRVVVTGNPVRKEIFVCSDQRSIDQVSGPMQILVTGGSLGSNFLNERVPNLLGLLADRDITFEVHHQAGNKDLDAIRAMYANLRIKATVKDYFDDMVDIYRQAHFAITCAGATTLAELAACGLPSLVVPLSEATHDHQTPNAKAYCEASGAMWTNEDNWNSTQLASAIAAQLSDAKVWSQKSQNARKLAQPNAAQKIVEECEDVMKGHW